jgi:hypothetical protein
VNSAVEDSHHKSLRVKNGKNLVDFAIVKKKSHEMAAEQLSPAFRKDEQSED